VATTPKIPTDYEELVTEIADFLKRTGRNSEQRYSHWNGMALPETGASSQMVVGTTIKLAAVKRPLHVMVEAAR
jgi:hypothetical protein